MLNTIQWKNLAEKFNFDFHSKCGIPHLIGYVFLYQWQKKKSDSTGKLLLKMIGTVNLS